MGNGNRLDTLLARFGNFALVMTPVTHVTVHSETSQLLALSAEQNLMWSVDVSAMKLIAGFLVRLQTRPGGPKRPATQNFASAFVDTWDLL